MPSYHVLDVAWFLHGNYKSRNSGNAKSIEKKMPPSIVVTSLSVPF